MFHRRQAGGEHARHQVGQAGGDQAVELARAGELGQRRGRAGVRAWQAPSACASRAASRRPRFRPWPATGCRVWAALPMAATRPCTWARRALSASGKRDAAPGWTGGRGGRRRRRSARAKAALSSAASSAARCGVLHQTTEWASGVCGWGSRASGPSDVKRSQASRGAAGWRAPWSARRAGRSRGAGPRRPRRRTAPPPGSAIRCRPGRRARRRRPAPGSGPAVPTAGHAALGDAGFEPGVEARIADHAAQLRHVEVGMADQAAAQAAALRDMDAADVGRAFRPGVQRFEQHAAAVVHGQHAWIGRGRGVRRGGGAVPCSSAMRAGSGATRASIRARTRPTGPAPRIAMSKAEAVMCGSLTVHYNRRQAACAVTPQER